MIPVSRQTPSRCGPIHCGQSSARAVVETRGRATALQHEECVFIVRCGQALVIEPDLQCSFPIPESAVLSRTGAQLCLVIRRGSFVYPARMNPLRCARAGRQVVAVAGLAAW